MNNIEAMKLALEALLGWGKGFPDNWGDIDTEAITALRQAIEQAEQKPCLKGGQCKHGSWCSEVYCQEHCEFVEQAEQAQPVTYGEVMRTMNALRTGTLEQQQAYGVMKDKPLYTAPPPRQPWAGLTDEDKQIAFDDTQEGGGFWEFADAIEATLRKKNHG
jgi:hypothetical protein